MKYTLGDRFIIKNIEAKVSYINGQGHAYLTPIDEGDIYENDYLLVGVVFTIINSKGLNKNGHKAHSIVKNNCGAV